ncbi:MAG TPA: EAL domain-containing protein [Allosphingosinicella sp.]|nr:EAL domain-containing protein [Allosphingosinicella sp.]
MIALPAENDLALSLQLAVERKELFMLYQPKISLRTGQMVGVEALMRWQSPQFGLVLPSLFIPIAERSGSIDELSEWGLKEVLRQWVGWAEQGLATNLAFNISALTLRDTSFPDFLQRMCLEFGVPREHLTIEVTEGATQSAIRMLDVITRFRIMGLPVELDDFGTGYSSLVQLRQLPYTGLKIDLCFVQDAAVHADARLIVKTVIDLAHGLGLTATAEGIEDHPTLSLLRDLGCDTAQGFLIAPPLRAPELAPWVLGPGAKWRWMLGEREDAVQKIRDREAA